MSLPPKLYPCLSYDDPAAAIEFLRTAFGFEVLLTVPGPGGVLVHAELNLGPEVIMLGSSKPELGWVSPRRLPAVNQVVCGFVPDVEAHYARAKAAGAVIVRELKTTDYGSTEYGAKDPEGHQWYFGTYRPAPGA